MKKCFCLAFLLLVFALASQPYAAQINRIAAVVNGQMITMFDLQRTAGAEIVRAGLNPSKPSDKAAIDAIMRKALDSMILDILIRQEAKRLEISIPDKDVDKEITQMYQSRGLTREQFEKELVKGKTTLKDMRENLRASMIRQRVMGREVGRRVVVTQQEIKDYYEKNKATMYNRKGLHMALIVYHPRAPYQKIARQVKSGEISWLEASRKYSVLPSRNQGGDSGEVQWDRLNEEWSRRLNQMQPGDVTNLFKINDQLWAQVRLYRPGAEQEPLRIMTLEEASPQIDAILRMPKAQERFQDYTRQLREKAVIDIRM